MNQPLYRTGKPVRGGKNYIKKPRPSHERTGTRYHGQYHVAGCARLIGEVFARCVPDDVLHAAQSVDNMTFGEGVK